MHRRRRAAIAVIILVPLLAGGFVLQERSREGARLFNQVLSLVSERFVDTLNTETLYEQAARGLLQQLNDPYTQLMTPAELRRFSTETGGRYGGTGMQIEEIQGFITVNRVFPHTPAEAAGIMEGDRIIQVEGNSTRGWTTAEVADSLLGTPGTRVRARFGRPGVAQPIDVTFTRAVIRIPAVPYAIMLDGDIGYVPLQGFNESATADLRESGRRLQREGARGLILDLRGNTGGILDQSLEVANLFLPRGREIASVRGRGMPPQVFVTESRAAFSEIPMIVLVDGRSASASEIVAGALQDHDRALIVGTSSFGKGLVQTLFNLDGGYALKMTTAKWFTPSGRTIQKERRLVDGVLEEVEPDSAAIERLREELRRRGETVPEHVAEMPDSLVQRAIRDARPVYRSAAGREVYGGGGITPDVIVTGDTLTSEEREFLRAVTPHAPTWRAALHEIALGLRGSVSRDFTVQQSWREDLFRRLTAGGVQLQRRQFEEALPWIDRQLERDVARVTFGDSLARRRDLPHDAQLRTALDLLRRGGSQKDLFTYAQAVVVPAERAGAALGRSP